MAFYTEIKYKDTEIDNAKRGSQFQVSMSKFWRIESINTYTFPFKLIN